MAAKREAPLTGGAANSAKVELHTVEKDSTKQRPGQGRRFRDSHIETLRNPLHFEQFGNSVERIEEVDRLLDETEKALKPCPFCGEAAMAEGVFTYYRPGVIVRCSRCFNGTIPFAQGFDMMKGHYETLEDCIDRAVKRWNMRGGKNE